MPRRLAPVLLLISAVALAAATDAHAAGGRGRHKRMFAVPTPGDVTIDGKLDDWDLSGQVWIYVEPETAAQRSARFAVMYDRQAIYLSGDVRDDTPMMNRHDPAVNGEWAWDADACQFRIVLDPAQGYPVNESQFNHDANDQMANLLLWYYTDRQEPNLQLDYGFTHEKSRLGNDKGVLRRDTFEAKYVKADDGRGYTFEYRIPWKTLGAKRPPKGGDLVAGTVQFNWGRPDGLKTLGGPGWAYDVMASPGFPFQTSACWGKIIFSPDGNVPKSLVEEGAPAEKPLPLTFEYDLPEDGEVTVALVNSDGGTVRNLVAQAARKAGRVVERWDGLDETGAPLPPGQYTWKGLYHQPIKTQFVLSVHNSGSPPYKTDDNTGGWGGDHGVPTTCCPVGDDMLLAWNACESGWGVIRVGPDGKKKWGSKQSAELLNGDGRRLFAAGGHGFHRDPGVKVFDAADSRPLNFGSGDPKLETPKGGDDESNQPTGLACGGGKVYVAYAGRDLVGVNDAASGRLTTTWNVPQPHAVAVSPDGSLVAVSQGKLARIEAGRVRLLATDHLDEPAGVAVDAEGTVYVANRGKLQNVSVFSPGGKYLRSIGRQGGRPWMGRYDPGGMLQPGGIAVDAAGRLWVAESLDGPKRVSVWDTRSGKLADEFFGGSAYSTFAWMDPEHPDEVYCHNVLWNVDLGTRTWRPHSTLWRPTDPNSPGGISSGISGQLRVVTATNGRQYGWCNYHAKGPCLFIREGDVMKPLLMFIRNIDWHSLTPWPPYPLFADKEKLRLGQQLWVDRNGDQVMQASETTYLGKDGQKFAFHWVDEELNLWCGAGYVHRPVRIEPDGRPVYDFEHPEETGIAGHNGHGPLVVDPQDGSIYTNSERNEYGWARWTPEGRMIWGHQGFVRWHEALNKGTMKPGKLWGPTCPLGVAGDFTGLATYFGAFQLYTRDGLFVAMVMNDGRLGGLGPDVIACELFSGQLVRPEGTDRYFLLAGDQDGRITEVKGLDSVKRLPGGTYELSKSDADRAARALEEYQRQKARGKPLVIVRGKPALAVAEGVEKAVDEGRSFRAAVAYDAANLYVSYAVKSPHPLTNDVADPKLVFKGGNLLDIQLACNPKGRGDRKKPAPGDVRLLVSRQDGRTKAVLFRPKVEGFHGEPTVLESPTGSESFDVIEPVGDRVELEYHEDRSGGGFTAVVTVPLGLVGLKLQPGDELKLDLGYIFGNATGTQAAVRAYWTNNSFTANVTGDVPHESRLEPQEWGTATVE